MNSHDLEELSEYLRAESTEFDGLTDSDNIAHREWLIRMANETLSLAKKNRATKALGQTRIATRVWQNGEWRITSGAGGSGGAS